MFRFLVLAFCIFSVIPIAKGESLNDVDATCGLFGKLAEGIMKKRQLGIPMSKIQEAISETNITDDQKKFVRGLVIFAYERPAYATQSSQDEETRNFRDEIELECYKSNQE